MNRRRTSIGSLPVRHQRGAAAAQPLKRPVLRRMARRAGIKRIGGTVYNAARLRAATFLTSVLRHAAVYTMHKRRKTIVSQDVLAALYSSHGIRLYSSDQRLPSSRPAAAGDDDDAPAPKPKPKPKAAKPKPKAAASPKAMPKPKPKAAASPKAMPKPKPKAAASPKAAAPKPKAAAAAPPPAPAAKRTRKLYNTDPMRHQIFKEIAAQLGALSAVGWRRPDHRLSVLLINSGRSALCAELKDRPAKIDVVGTEDEDDDEAASTPLFCVRNGHESHHLGPLEPFLSGHTAVKYDVVIDNTEQYRRGRLIVEDVHRVLHKDGVLFVADWLVHGRPTLDEDAIDVFDAKYNASRGFLNEMLLLEQGKQHVRLYAFGPQSVGKLYAEKNAQRKARR